MIKHPLYSGCTASRFAAIGVDAKINARAGKPELNDLDQEAIELQRDARAICARIEGRVRWYGPSSKFFRRNIGRVRHLVVDRDLD